MITVTDAPYNAKGNCRLVEDAAMTAGSPTLTSATAAFVASDVGATVYVYGAGASGATLIATVTTINSGTQVTLSVSASTTVSSKRMWLGSDDTAAIQAAISAAGPSGDIVYFPPRRYLVTGNIGAANCQLQGTGIGDGETPYTDNGSQLWQANTANPMLSINGKDVTVTGLVFFYPDQTGLVATPTTYAPTIQTTTAIGIVNLTIDNCQFTNSFVCIKIIGAPASSVFHGRILITRVRAYAIQTFLDGRDIKDVVHVSDCNISNGIWQDISIGTPDQYPAKWTIANGSAFLLNDPFDGLFMTNTVVYGYYAAVRATQTSNPINWLSLNQVHIDGCRNGIIANASLPFATINACNFYCVDPFSASSAGSSIVLAPPANSAVSDVIVSSCNFAFALGNHIAVDGDILSLQIVGCRIKFWAQRQGISGIQQAIRLTNWTSAQVVVCGCTFVNSTSATGVAIGSTTSAAGRIQITGNEFYGCQMAVDAGPGYFVITGNSAHNTTATYGCVRLGSVNSLVQTGNSWDVTTAGVVSTLLPTLAFGTVAANGSTTVNVTVPGAMVNDSVALGLPTSGNWVGKLLFQAHVSLAGTVAVVAQNPTAAPVTVNSIAVRINVLPRG